MIKSAFLNVKLPHSVHNAISRAKNIGDA